MGEGGGDYSGGDTKQTAATFDSEVTRYSHLVTHSLVAPASRGRRIGEQSSQEICEQSLNEIGEQSLKEIGEQRLDEIGEQSLKERCEQSPSFFLFRFRKRKMCEQSMLTRCFVLRHLEGLMNPHALSEMKA